EPCIGRIHDGSWKRAAPFEDSPTEPAPHLSGVAGDPPEHLCHAPAVPRSANQCRPESTGRPRLPVNQAGPATAVSRNPGSRHSAAGRTISKLSQRPAIPDNEATQPTAGAPPTGRLPKDSLRSGPSETGSSKNRAALLTLIERNAAHDWQCPSAQNQ